MMQKQKPKQRKRKRKRKRKMMIMMILNQHKELENISNEYINENFPKLKKVPVNVQETSKMLKRLGKSPFDT